jgi:hypothetical protein
MKTLKIGVILLAFLLAAMVMVPMVNATGSTNPVAQINASQIQLPFLHFNNSQQKVLVNDELSVSQSPAVSQSNQLTSISYQNQGVTSIPSGAIIYHGNNVTTVFDASGNQLFSAEDNQAATIHTYRGEQPATFVHGVPSNSTVVNMGDTLHVIYKGIRILTIIRNTSDSGQPSSTQSSTTGTPTSCNWGTAYFNNNDPYVEGTDTYPNYITSPKEFSTYWYVPSSPVGNPGSYTTGNEKMVAIWNGLYGCEQGDSSSLLVQPVLEWFYYDPLMSSYPTTAQWTAAAWYVWGTPKITVNGVKNIDFIHSTRITGVNPGDEMEGNIQISTTGYDAIGSITDLTGSAGSTTLWLNQYTEEGGVTIPVRMSTQDLYATIMMEGWTPSITFPGSATNLPGPVTFSNFILTDQQGDNLLSTTPMNTYIDHQNWNQSTFSDYGNLSVYNQWPSTIVLLNNPARINPPGVSFTGSPRTGSGADYVIFQDQSTGSPFLWNWSFGDGTYSANQNPAHYYTSPGSYAVNLTVVGPGGVRFNNQPNYIVVS